jgi:L-fuconolactonase
MFVLDHVAKPRIREGSLFPWRKGLSELAKRPNVYCKLSGMVTEAEWHSWSPKKLQPYFDVVLEVFTPRRLMFGSDWPVLLIAGNYQQWITVVRDVIGKLSDGEQKRIMGGTAAEAYRLTLS